MLQAAPIYHEKLAQLAQEERLREARELLQARERAPRAQAERPPRTRAGRPATAH